MRRQLHVTPTLISILLWLHGIDGFSKEVSSNRRKIQDDLVGNDSRKRNLPLKLTELTEDFRSNDKVTESSSSSSSSSSTTSSCPFSKHFPKYRIDFTRVNAPDDQGFSLRIPFVSNVQTSIQKSLRQKNFPPEVTIQWMDEEEESVQAITLFERLWREASNLYSPVSGRTPRSSSRTVLGLADTSHFAVVQHWVDILNWMQNEKSLATLLGDSKIDATIHNDGGMILVDLDYQGINTVTLPSPSRSYDPAALTRKTQAWVKRILVDQGICPFTKSVKVSGQGLGDLGIPVARIHYCSSDANQQQLCQLMADSWREIAFMLDMGPSGRDGISSILLAAPEYDNDFDLWAGPVFAMLESGVVACGLEKEVGVVCFHPQYATPDGRSFPGFGHMHSVPRLKKWWHETVARAGSSSDAKDSTLELTDEEIAAGGAWQRRTPHATINVLRADQLEAAEGRRVTSELYSDNIQKLVGKPDGIGSKQLQEDLDRERAL